MNSDIHARETEGRKIRKNERIKVAGITTFVPRTFDTLDIFPINGLTVYKHKIYKLYAKRSTFRYIILKRVSLCALTKCTFMTSPPSIISKCSETVIC